MSDLPDPIRIPGEDDAPTLESLAREVRLRNGMIKAKTRELADARALLAALVLTYGEPVATGHRRAGVSGRTMERASGSTLSVHMDPGSGAVLIHVREG